MMDTTLFIVLMQSITTLGVAFLGYLSVRFRNTVRKLEENTNSMKDALIKVTKESSHAEGVLEGQRIAKETP